MNEAAEMCVSSCVGGQEVWEQLSTQVDAPGGVGGAGGGGGGGGEPEEVQSLSPRLAFFSPVRQSNPLAPPGGGKEADERKCKAPPWRL